ncbi:hypothetical protein SNE40_021831 [Patella caerulea]
MIALQFLDNNQQYTPLLIDDPDDLKEVNFEDGRYLLILDDVFGRYNTLEDRKDKWPKHFGNFRIQKEKGRLACVYIMRDYIYNSCKCHLEGYNLFTPQTELKLHKGLFHLNSHEREEILKFYKVDKSKITNILKSDYFGFPAIASLSSNIAWGELPNDLRSADDYLLLQLKLFWDKNKHIYTTLSLIFCLHSVPMGDLGHPNDRVNTVIKSIKDDIYETFELSRARDQIKELSETFIRIYENNYIKMASLLDFVVVPFLCHFSEKSLKLTLEYCPFELLMAVIRTKDETGCMVIEHHEGLSSRFIRELQDKNYAILTHSAFLDSSFLSKFLDIKDISDLLRDINLLSLGEINATEETGNILHYISLKGDITCLQIILAYFQTNFPMLINNKTKFGWDVVSLATVSMIEPIEKLDELLKTLKYADLATLPRFAVYSSKYSVVQHIAKFTNFDSKLQDNKLRTLLHNACVSIHDVSKIIDFLAEKGFDLNSKDKDGCTPLHLAANRGKTETVSILIKRGANVFVKDNMGRSPCHAACAAEGGGNEPIDVLDLLMEAGCPINEPDNAGRTPFLEAVSNVNNKCIQYFVKHLAGFEISDELRQVYVIKTCTLNDISIFQSILDILIPNKSFNRFIDKHVLFKCCDSIEKMKCFYTKGADLYTVGNCGCSLLHHACCQGTIETVNFLVNDIKLDIHYKTRKGESAAFHCSHTQINPVDKLVFLKSKGGDLSTVDNHNRSLLHHACCFGTTELVEFLVNVENLDVNGKDDDGYSPAFHCSDTQINPVEKLKLLSSNGGDLSTVDNRNRSLLSRACCLGTTEMVKYLVNIENLDVNHKDEDGYSPAFHCPHSQINPVDKLKFLKSKGVKFDTVDSSNCSLLHIACEQGTAETVNFYLSLK